MKNPGGRNTTGASLLGTKGPTRVLTSPTRFRLMEVKSQNRINHSLTNTISFFDRSN